MTFKTFDQSDEALGPRRTKAARKGKGLEGREAQEEGMSGDL